MLHTFDILYNSEESKMYCLKCSTKNSEGRKFCRECGSLIVNFCQECGFINSLTDKYCGGCGTNLLNMKTSDSKEDILSQGKYSASDIRELIDEHSQKKDKKPKKKEIKETGEVSQDLLDTIFGPDDSETKEKEN